MVVSLAINVVPEAAKFIRAKLADRSGSEEMAVPEEAVQPWEEIPYEEPIPPGVLSLEEGADRVTLRGADGSVTVSYAALPITLPIWLADVKAVASYKPISGYLAAVLSSNGVTVVRDDIRSLADCVPRRTRVIVLIGESDRTTEVMFPGQDVAEVKRLLEPLRSGPKARDDVAEGFADLRRRVRAALEAGEQVVILFNTGKPQLAHIIEGYLHRDRVVAIGCNTHDLERFQYRTTTFLDLDSVIQAALQMRASGKQACLDEFLHELMFLYNSAETLRGARRAAVLLPAVAAFGGGVYAAFEFAKKGAQHDGPPVRNDDQRNGPGVRATPPGAGGGAAGPPAPDEGGQD